MAVNSLSTINSTLQPVNDINDKINENAEAGLKLNNNNPNSIIYQFLNSIDTDPTMLSVDFQINKNSILFCTTEKINITEGGNFDFWDKNSMLNDFCGNSEVFSTPYILLNNLNESARAKMLKSFIEGFTKIIKEQQWRIQSVDGIDSIFTSLINYKEGYMGSGDEKIVITCLEDIKLTMYTLFELYRNAIYDQVYKRQLVPNNLLLFDCEFIIQDKRNLVSRFTNTGINIEDNLKVSKNQIKLKLCNCLFDFSSNSKMFANINPGEFDNNIVQYSFSFKFGKAYMETPYITRNVGNNGDIKSKNAWNVNSKITAAQDEDNTTLAQLISGGWDGALNSAKQQGKTYLDNVIKNNSNALEEYGNKISKIGNGFEQGYEVGQNIYGSNFISAYRKKADDLLNRVQSGSLLEENLDKVTSAAKNKVNRGINSLNSDKNSTNYESTSSTASYKTGSKLGESVYSDVDIKNSEMKEHNIYENQPSGPKQ